jgi:alkylated DNA repair protein (DNA oxidative demethylase)
LSAAPAERELLAEGAWLLRGFAAAEAAMLVHQVHAVATRAPFRRMVVPSGQSMSVAMTNCGAAGWITDRSGYRYAATDPQSGCAWPGMPTAFLALATAAAGNAGFPDFVPDACLVNRYEPGARMSLHQDRDERDFTAPIVSVSLGLPAVFLFGGTTRREKARRVAVENGDVVVWGGPARLVFHGVARLAEGTHPLTGRFRYNLTLRRAR